MKSISLFVVAVLVATTSLFAQSNSYQTLKDKFKDQPDVHSFSMSGWMGRLVLNMAGEFEFREAIKDLKHVDIITIPNAEFSALNLSVSGFKKVLKKDAYEELALIRDHGGEVSIYLREGSNNKNLYFVLVEEENEVVAIELKGYLDPKLLNPKNTKLAINK
jgi:Domain of unknown function (DUF4252)